MGRRKMAHEGPPIGPGRIPKPKDGLGLAIDHHHALKTLGLGWQPRSPCRIDGGQPGAAGDHDCVRQAVGGTDHPAGQAGSGFLGQLIDLAEGQPTLIGGGHDGGGQRML